MICMCVCVVLALIKMQLFSRQKIFRMRINFVYNLQYIISLCYNLYALLFLLIYCDCKFQKWILTGGIAAAPEFQKEVEIQSHFMRLELSLRILLFSLLLIERRIEM